jgi:hypothetical protein
MADLSALTDYELGHAEEACEFLMELREEHEAIDGELSGKLGALLSGIRLAQNDRRQIHRRTCAAAAPARQHGHAGKAVSGTAERAGGDAARNSHIDFLAKLAAVLERANITITITKDDHEQAR